MLLLCLRSCYGSSSFMVKSELIAIMAYKDPGDLDSATSSNSSQYHPLHTSHNGHIAIAQAS